ncbi:MAG: hypothetical protein COU08_02980 [Candidatus Harrisonbacteria bacterium CG10_big_fil_rev_8_21_14_0_10_42_17]|uniref:Uncharacterized protein n=1 Tax=Candidatus Harrisonbacteria bacterium CG10_big_fil_rev_8_21_14_0_10_42_17 TaxID=1974584 RepID=A0A2M6WHU0_9BACT|nr:MAG: hypothetical protein COU08_02980 [Candidatus Harrisonbacteria bacterium CG10_big_fil_rev_8_21_14_0_10_42_17]
MGFMDNMKMAQNMMKNMSPEEIKELMEQAKQQKTLIDEQIGKIVEEEIKKRDLVSREEVQKMIEGL